MYSFFYGMFNHESTNNLDSVMNSTFHMGSLTNAPDSSIAHIWREQEREARQNESEIQKKSKVGGKNNFKL